MTKILLFTTAFLLTLHKFNTCLLLHNQKENYYTFNLQNFVYKLRLIIIII